jgi:glycosyltransferase involved in cell wall biosynthesis
MADRPAPAGPPRLTVLQVRSSRGLHGPERTILELAPALAARGVAVPVLALHRAATGAPAEHPMVAPARRIGLHAETARDPGPLHPAAFVAIARRLADPALDAVHTHDYRADLLVSVASRRRHRPWIATVHLRTDTTARLRLYARLARVALRRADRIVAVSAAQRDALAAQGLPRERLVLVRTAVDAEALARAAADAGGAAAGRRQAGGGADDPLLVLVGRLTRQKGVDVALRALARLRSAHPTARLVVAGDGPEARGLRELASTLGLDGAVRWLGAVGDPLPLLAAADVVLMPSRAEGLPRVALEAAALGRPVVGATVGGMVEAVAHEATGLLVPPDDLAALAAAAGALLADPDRARRLGAAAEARVRREFALEGAAAALEALYRSVCAEQPGGTG